MASRCPVCKQKVAPDATFCPRDGTPLEPTVAPKVVEYTDMEREKTLPGRLPSDSSEHIDADAATQPPKPPSSGKHSVVVSPSLERDLPAASEPTVRRDPMIGQLLGEYEVLERVGSGGMGVVYRAMQPMIGKEVAIKLLRPDAAGDPVSVKRLLEEARSVNAIRHRGIIDIFGFGSLSSGDTYVVMEFLHGRSLDQVIHQQAPMPPLDVLKMLAEVLAALGAAHGAGVIHRDIKPHNIFVVEQPDGTRFLKVLDFGLAKRAPTPHGSTPQTRMDMTVGTPEYIAPEQARAQAVSPRTDLYSLGCIAFEMLTGKVPFEAANVTELMIAHVNTPPPVPSSRVPDIPRAVDAWVLSLLEKDPEKRPRSAEEARMRALGLVRELSRSPTTKVPSAELRLPRDTVKVDADRLVDTVRTRRWVPVLISAAALVAAVAVIAGYVGSRGIEREVAAVDAGAPTRVVVAAPFDAGLAEPAEERDAGSTAVVIESKPDAGRRAPTRPSIEARRTALARKVDEFIHTAGDDKLARAAAVELLKKVQSARSEGELLAAENELQKLQDLHRAAAPRR